MGVGGMAMPKPPTRELTGQSSTMIVLIPLSQAEMSEAAGSVIYTSAPPQFPNGRPTPKTAQIAVGGTKELLGMFGGPEFAVLVPGSDEGLRFDEFTRTINEQHAAGVLAISGVVTKGLPPGKQLLDLKFRDKPVYDKYIYVPASSNIYCILKRERLGSIVLDRFIPDITKPAP